MAYTAIADITMANIPTAYTSMASGPAVFERVPTGQMAMAYTVMADMAMANIPTTCTAMASVPAVFERVPTHVEPWPTQ